jgi:hypothetical protein
MQLDHKTSELSNLQELNLNLLIAFSALYSLRLFEVVDLVQDTEFPPALLHTLKAGLLALAMLIWLAGWVSKLRPEVKHVARHISIDDLDKVTFRLRFRFRQAHLWEMMAEFELLDPHGVPLVLQVGRPGHQLLIQADTAFLTLLCKLMVHGALWGFGLEGF